MNVGFFLKDELKKKEINRIDIFINLVFKDLFNELHKSECINNFEELITFEKDLEKLINDKITFAKTEIEKLNQLNEKNKKDKNSPINLLQETYGSENYTKDYPYYEYFYYCDYLDEKNISEKLSHYGDKAYPMLRKYLDFYNNHKNEKDDYSLENLYIFNKALNLISEKYSHQIK